MVPCCGWNYPASVFYKHFLDPIEPTNLANDVFCFANATNADAYGIELELRKRLVL